MGLSDIDGMRKSTERDYSDIEYYSGGPQKRSPYSDEDLIEVLNQYIEWEPGEISRQGYLWYYRYERDKNIPARTTMEDRFGVDNLNEVLKDME